MQKLPSYGKCMNKINIWQLLICYIASAFTGGYASELISVDELLVKMKQAQYELNYQGTFVFKHGEKLDAMQIMHGHVDGKVKQRIVSLNDVAREVIRDGELVKCIWPKKRLVVVGPTSSYNGMPTIVPKDLSNVSDVYQIHSTDFNQIAGKTCQLVSITPTDSYRYGYEFCIQPQTGMLLRSKIIDTKKNKVLEEMLFTEVNYMSSSEALIFDSKYDLSNFKWKKSFVSEFKSIHKDISPQRLKISQLPQDFVLMDTSQRKIKMSAKPVRHMVFSDSIASVSIFISESGGKDRLKTRLTGRGAINAFTKSNERYKITVLGEVPSETVELIGASVMFK